MKRIVLFSFFLCFIRILSSQTIIYVSVNGHDSAPGTKEQPVGSLTSALECIRKMPGNEPVTVRIASGTYYMDQPLRLTEKDSRPIFFEGDSLYKPVFSGAIAVSGWKINSQGWWTCHLPEVERFGLYFEQFFVNGVRATRARTPDKEWFMIKSSSEQIHYQGTARSPEYATQRLNVNPEDIRSITSIKEDELPDLTAIFYHKWDNTRKRINYFSVDSGSLFLSGKGMKSWNPLETGTRYILENYKGALSMPGEWFLSRKGDLFYIPRAGEKPETAQCFAPVLKQLVEITGTAGNPVRNKTFRNISFQHSANLLPSAGDDPMQVAAGIDAAIQLDFAENILFDNCEVMHTGNYAVSFSRACHSSEMRHSYLYDLGAGGIKIGEPFLRDDQLPVTSEIKIDNNIIHHTGQVFPCGGGVVVFNASNNKITHNEISDLRYTGISLGWMWGYADSGLITTYMGNQGALEYKSGHIVSPAINNEVAYNHIHHIGWGELSDMGAIYTLGESPGTHIHNNTIHDVYSYDYGGWGLYTDEGSSHILIENNLVYGCKSGGFHQHYGKENIIRNNIFAFGHYYQLQFTRVEPHLSFSFERNIVLMDCGVLLSGPWDKATIEMDRNCYWSLPKEDPSFLGTPFKVWKKNKDKHSVVADPLFKDPYALDFEFKSNQTIRKIGFVPFDPKQAGVYGTSEWKTKALLPQEMLDEFKQIILKREKQCSEIYK